MTGQAWRMGLEAIRGFYQSVRPATGRLLLNVNVTYSVFFEPGLLADLFSRFGNGHGVADKIKRKRIEVTHLPAKKSRTGATIPREKSIWTADGVDRHRRRLLSKSPILQFASAQKALPPSSNDLGPHSWTHHRGLLPQRRDASPPVATQNKSATSLFAPTALEERCKTNKTFRSGQSPQRIRGTRSKMQIGNNGDIKLWPVTEIIPCLVFYIRTMAKRGDGTKKASTPEWR